MIDVHFIDNETSAPLPHVLRLEQLPRVGEWIDLVRDYAESTVEVRYQVVGIKHVVHLRPAAERFYGPPNTTRVFLIVNQRWCGVPPVALDQTTIDAD